jgi:hypothetical protein
MPCCFECSSRATRCGRLCFFFGILTKRLSHGRCDQRCMFRIPRNIARQDSLLLAQRLRRGKLVQFGLSRNDDRGTHAPLRWPSCPGRSPRTSSAALVRRHKLLARVAPLCCCRWRLHNVIGLRPSRFPRQGPSHDQNHCQASPYAAVPKSRVQNRLALGSQVCENSLFKPHSRLDARIPCERGIKFAVEPLVVAALQVCAFLSVILFCHGSPATSQQIDSPSLPEEFGAPGTPATAQPPR